MSELRRECRKIRVGKVEIGGGAPISVQSMTNTDTRDAQATLAQIERLYKAGADIVRVSVYDEKCAQAVRTLVDHSPVPLVADIHFDHKLALAAMENGIHKLRINPGNIERQEDVRRVVDCAKAHHVPIRIGVNAGSLPRDLVESQGVTPESMVEAALRHVRILEECGFYDIALSLKASDVRTNVLAYRRMAEICDYPLHLGVTEAGRRGMGNVKSDIGIGSLLLDGIGDTLRVSLSGDPEPEVQAGINILRAIGLRKDAVNIVSCPTCGRNALMWRRWPRRWKRGLRAWSCPSPWRSWAAWSTAPEKRSMRTWALRAAAARARCSAAAGLCAGCRRTGCWMR